MRHSGRTEHCPVCGTRLERDFQEERPGFIADTEDWSSENGGKGRRNPQLDAETGDKTHFRSRREMVSYLKGQYFDKAGSQGRSLVVDA
jgi:hypothetical protein